MGGLSSQLWPRHLCPLAPRSPGSFSVLSRQAHPSSVLTCAPCPVLLCANPTPGGWGSSKEGASPSTHFGQRSIFPNWDHSIQEGSLGLESALYAPPLKISLNKPWKYNSLNTSQRFRLDSGLQLSGFHSETCQGAIPKQERLLLPGQGSASPRVAQTKVTAPTISQTHLGSCTRPSTASQNPVITPLKMVKKSCWVRESNSHHNSYIPYFFFFYSCHPPGQGRCQVPQQGSGL